jgi:hypothetical protein
MTNASTSSAQVFVFGNGKWHSVCRCQGLGRPERICWKDLNLALESYFGSIWENRLRLKTLTLSDIL